MINGDLNLSAVHGPCGLLRLGVQLGSDVTIVGGVTKWDVTRLQSGAVPAARNSQPPRPELSRDCRGVHVQQTAENSDIIGRNLKSSAAAGTLNSTLVHTL